jgi:hypothetical protein
MFSFVVVVVVIVVVVVVLLMLEVLVAVVVKDEEVLVLVLVVDIVVLVVVVVVVVLVVLVKYVVLLVSAAKLDEARDMTVPVAASSALPNTPSRCVSKLGETKESIVGLLGKRSTSGNRGRCSTFAVSKSGKNAHNIAVLADSQKLPRALAVMTKCKFYLDRPRVLSR